MIHIGIHDQKPPFILKCNVFLNGNGMLRGCQVYKKMFKTRTVSKRQKMFPVKLILIHTCKEKFIYTQTPRVFVKFVGLLTLFLVL